MNRQEFLVLFVSFIAYTGLGVYYGDKLSIDDAEYLKISENLIAGELPQVKIQRIVHFYTIAIMQWLFNHNVMLIRFYLILVSTGSVYFMYHILRTKYSADDSFWGALLFASGPALVYVSPTMLMGPVGLFYSLFGLYLYLSAKDDMFILMASAVVFAVGFLTRETVIAMFLAVVASIAMKKEVKRFLVFSFSFATLPALFAVWLPMDLMLKWIFFIVDTTSVTPGIDYMPVFFRIVHFVIGLQILGFIGAYTTLTGILKCFKQKQITELERILLTYMLVSLVLIVTWPLTNIRYYMALLPVFGYYTIGYFPRQLLGYKKQILALVIIAGFAGGYAVGYFFLGLEKPTEDAVSWINTNINKHSRIYTNYDALEYNLMHKGFTITDTFADANFIVEIYVPVTAGFESQITQAHGMILVKEFKYVRPPLVQKITYGSGQTVRILRTGF